MRRTVPISIWLVPTLMTASIVAGCASTTIEAGDLGKTRDTSAGAVLVDSRGMTLYTYDRDVQGKSNCSGRCAIAWPPAEARPGVMATGDFSILMRDGGDRQWAYKGKPLYGYIKDSKLGDVTGDGDDGVWHAAKP